MGNVEDKIPSSAVIRDAESSHAPNPRKHYASPEELREDVELDLETRENLLREWKQDLDQRLEAESEGMSASDPMSGKMEARLAAEARRVTNALQDISEDRKRAGDIA